jgi:hypothetical protein
MAYEHRKGHKSVFGIFDSLMNLEIAVDMLKESGYRNSDISVLMPSREETQNFAHEKATKAPEGATTGVTSGLAVGGALGWLIGIGALAIPGLGPFVAAGPIMSAIAGAGVGATVGGIAGALVGFGIPEYEAKRYENFVKEGAFLISVHGDDSEWLDKAKSILKACEARDISSTSEVQGSDDEDLKSYDKTSFRQDQDRADRNETLY